ncbi:DUF1513 domain-containing protein [Octadecabacter antarcticus]|uniref:DUF1513 domain-containing protein n=1 Tax=Octadecabacter antarcticus TaxID=1217908 RepID=UPI001FDF3413|nr:DUF1513 domain-containing protein [Octadecabacter antarcticus]
MRIHRRRDEWDSGGIGPIANGGIGKHPDTGRTKLKIPTMPPDLAYFGDDNVVKVATFPLEMHKNSIRHLAFGMQWQGDGPVDGLVGIYQIGSPVNRCSGLACYGTAYRGFVAQIALMSCFPCTPDGLILRQWCLGCQPR